MYPPVDGYIRNHEEVMEKTEKQTSKKKTYEEKNAIDVAMRAGEMMREPDVEEQ